MRDDEDDRPDWRRGPAPVTVVKPPHTQRHPSQADIDAAARRVEAARARTKAIDACTLCDDEGYRCDQAGHRLAVCDHIDRTDTAKRGIALIRATLAAKVITAPEP